MLHTEIAALILEVLTVHSEQLAEDLALDLIYKVVNSVSINKAAFLGIMSM